MIGAHGAQRRFDVAGLGDHLDALLGIQHHLQAGAHDGVVVGDDDARRRRGGGDGGLLLLLGCAHGRATIARRGDTLHRNGHGIRIRSFHGCAGGRDADSRTDHSGIAWRTMRRIVIGYDGSERGADALALGQALAELAGGSVDVAIALVFPDGAIGASGVRQLDGEHRQAADRILAGARRAWPELGPGAFSLVQAGSPAAGLHRLAQERDADALVVGASHHGAAGRVFPGSATEQTLHGAPCAVLVAPPGYATAGAPHALRRVGVAYDGSREARVALAAARTLVRDRDDVTVVVLDVVDLSHPFAIPYEDPTFVEDVQAIADEQLREAGAALRGVAHVELDRRDGDPVRELVDATHALDLLVLGSRGHGPIRRLLLGSVSTHVVRAAACPLLLLPHGAEAPASGATPAERAGAKA